MLIWRINKGNPEFVLQINNFMYQKKKLPHLNFHLKGIKANFIRLWMITRLEVSSLLWSHAKLFLLHSHSYSSHTYHPLTSPLKGYALSEIIAILNVYKNAIFERKKLSQYVYYVICFLKIYVYWGFVFNSKTFLFNSILSNILINTTDEAT